ncbi:MAG: transferrin-binding protein-like solute binding protein [Alysiella sp.]|uniref:transferrin-binding protein-like solute binding protein n=1 Tax=Alysiella sp. TaxID=1872483 RepID=UPI0026DC6165|nr:transferrin-binding protein-like solute binding protein [Alysiella sp.]MDO4433040.1 transferrin-binding protein-like solute binding protein [Alysiella sp.]
MSSIKLLGISLLSTTLLAACASGKGGFDLDNVRHDTTSGATKPTYQDDTSNPRRDTEAEVEALNQPSLGYAVEIPRRNLRANPAQSEKLNITADKVQSINYNLDDVPTILGNRIRAEKINAHQLFNPHPGTLANEIEYSHDGNDLLNKRNFTYIRSGYVIGENKLLIRFPENIFYKAGYMGYVFYQGSNPSVVMPTQTVSYKGYWDFVSNADKSRSTLPTGFHKDNFNTIPGQDVGATSLDANLNRRDISKPLGQTAEFTADFGNKRLTGTLTSNGSVTGTQKINDRYTINADIKGNRFRGSATATDSNHAIFGKDAKNLEGGFFGPNAEELAGKFLADDHSLFAVFGAKRENNLTADQMQTAFDAVKIDSGSLKKENADTFGNAAYLVINGKQFALIPDGKKKFSEMDFSETVKRDMDGKKYAVTVCCNNLDYVKFGNYGEEDTTAGHGGTLITVLKNGNFFLTGERSPLSAIPNSGNVRYQGTWEAKILSQNGSAWTTNAGNKPSSSRSLFDFDFAAKSFTGKLIADNGTEDIPTFTLKGNIDKNGFSGTAETKAGGFQLDGGSTGAGTLVNIKADINGAFYGPNASEIGGTIHKDGTGDKIGGVFGGKRQVVK